MQRRAFLGVAGVGTAALAGCLEGLFGDDDDTPGGTDTPPDGTGPGTPTDDPGGSTPTDDPGGSTPTDEPGDDAVVVDLRDRQFDPRNLSVERGTTVRWRNEDAVDHTVTSASDNWDVDMAVPADQSREYTFEDDGVYDAYCSIHGAADLTGMAMRIAVGDATIEDPLPDDDYPY